MFGLVGPFPLSRAVFLPPSRLAWPESLIVPGVAVGVGVAFAVGVGVGVGAPLGPNVMSNGCEPTSATVEEAVSDGISITVTVVDLVSDTYSFVWSALICDMKGPCPAGIVAMTVCVAVLMTETVSEYVLDTKAFVPSAVITSSHGYCPVGMVAITLNVEVLMTETVPLMTSAV